MTEIIVGTLKIVSGGIGKISNTKFDRLCRIKVALSHRINDL